MPAYPVESRGVSWLNAPTRDDLNIDTVWCHPHDNLSALKEHYQRAGWDVDVMLQDPGHQGPTAAKAIGFPFNFPLFMKQFSRWGDSVILRLHVDVIRCRGDLVSWPHLEPDPRYEPQKHLEMYLAKNPLRGAAVINVFGRFFIGA